MQTLYRQRLGGRLAVAVATDADDGDVHPLFVDGADLLARQLRTTGRPWAMLDEVHGVAVREIVEAPDPYAGTGEPRWPLAGVGDVLVTGAPDVALAIWAADCAPVAVFGAGGTTVAFHAGWKGLAAGIVDVALATFAARADTPAVAALGPVIHPCCYDFGTGDLATVAAALDVAPDRLTATSRANRPALDVPAAVAAALERRGVPLAVVGPCTGCGGALFSHRRRQDRARHALVAWTEVPGDGGGGR